LLIHGSWEVEKRGWRKYNERRGEGEEGEALRGRCFSVILCKMTDFMYYYCGGVSDLK
jgi:hypothetical protein